MAFLRSFRRRPPSEECKGKDVVGGVVDGGTPREGITRSNAASPSKSLLVSAAAVSLDCFCSTPPSVHSLSSTAAASELWGAARPSFMMPLPPPPPASLDSTSSSSLPLLPILAGMLILRSDSDDPTPLKDLPACLTMDDDLLLTKDETALPFFA